MKMLMRSFATGPSAPPLTDAGEVDRLYRSNRIRVMLAITVGAALGGLELAVALVLATSLAYGFLPSLLAFRQVLTRRA